MMRDDHKEKERNGETERQRDREKEKTGKEKKRGGTRIFTDTERKGRHAVSTLKHKKKKKAAWGTPVKHGPNAPTKC